MNGCQRRRAFTIGETVVALAVLALALLMVAQAGVWSLRERVRSAARQEALELAANVLETARAGPWDALTPEWAGGQQLPESLADRLPEAKLTVRVEPEAKRPRTKRVTVTISWKPSAALPAAELCKLVGLFSSRSAPVKEEKP